MLIEIPGKKTLDIRNLVFDYNGTIATDGKIAEDTKKKLIKLSEQFKIYILTADTYGTAKKQCENLDIELKTFPEGDAGTYKSSIFEEIDPLHTACFGNGFNDIKMFKKAIMSISIIGGEGLCTELLKYSTITVKDISDAIDLFLNTKRIIADLRA